MSGKNRSEGQQGKVTWLAALAGLLLAITAGCDSQGNADRHVFDLQGNTVSLLSRESSNTVVLIFVATQCPISNRYVPEMKRLHERFTARNVQFYLVYPDPDVTATNIREHLKEYELPDRALRDPQHTLVRAAQVRVTPEAAVFRGGTLIYHGRIDDRYPAFGVDRGAPTERDLENVLQAVTTGRQVAVTSRPAVGCVIPPQK